MSNKQTTVKTTALKFEVAQSAHAVSDDAVALFNSLTELANRRLTTQVDMARKIGKVALKGLFTSRGEGAGSAYALETLINDDKPASRAVRSDLKSICAHVGVKFSEIDGKQVVKAVSVKDCTTWQQVAAKIEGWIPKAVYEFENPQSPEDLEKKEREKKAKLNAEDGKTESGVSNVKKCMIRSVTRLGSEYSSPVLANATMMLLANFDKLEKPFADMVAMLESQGMVFKTFNDIK